MTDSRFPGDQIDPTDQTHPDADSRTSETMTDASPARAPTAGATFHATRDELVGDQPLLGSAEIARSYCCVADRVASVVAITPGRIRRVDCWLGGVGFVTHAASTDPSQALLGSVCDRDRAAELTGSLVASLVGGIPSDASDSAFDLGNVGNIAPSTIPAGADWVVIVSSKHTEHDAAPQRIVIAGRAGGLVVASLESLDGPTRVEPATPAEFERRLAALLGPAPKSVVELLSDG
jgi:hypothetical protein